MTRADEPLDLGVVGRDPDPEADGLPDRPERRDRRRLWAAVALAFLVGGVIGLVVADARDDTAGQERIELYGGPVRPVIVDRGPPRGELTVSVLNAGDSAVEILGVVVEGMTIDGDAEAADPVTADPGRWVSYVQRGLEVDCDGPMPDAMRVRARTPSGEERLVDVEPPDNHEGLRGFWYVECQAAYQFGLGVRDSTVLSRGDGAVVLALELANTGPDDLRLGAVAARAPGFALTTGEAEPAVPAGDSATLTTTWTVTDCDLALTASGGSLAVRILHGDAETEQIIVLPEQAFTALARLSGQSCPATIQE
ncbi:hypothetical protein [Jiangella rhizosphaerae]|uniref:Uncharacterized protein n=1 Tax=Jiangella rhizosphaerae TaxID=2293569 RepID=A0A418KP87_9ACTN|nr:hypothetical protein [Jiangella rhizosphaerae]RIQ20808.1 hypothetical protein DY240_16530 [Jiangella rhizosphaerae]